MSDENTTGDNSTSTVLTGDNANSDTTADDVPGNGQDTSSSQENAGSNNTDDSSQTPPDTYADFSLPEGMSIDEGLLNDALPIFKELGLTQEQAQKLVDFQSKQVQASSQSQVDAHNQLMNDWREKSKNDSEFGGDKFEESIAIARSALNKFGTPELTQLLEEHGVGNHPEVIRFMVKVGKLTAEDIPGSESAPVTKEQDRVNQLYPNDRNIA